MKTKHLSFPCPCGGQVEWKKERVIQDGIDCGSLDVEVCTSCFTQYLPDGSMEVVEEKLKHAGLWGMERKEIKFWKTGNAVTIRLPTGVVKKLNLTHIDKGFLYQEGRNKLVIEI